MTTFDRADEEIESRFRVGWAFPDILALGLWVNPAVGGLGALVLGGYLLTADPAIPVAPAAAPVSVVQMAPSQPMPAQLALSSDTAIVVRSSATHDESTRTSTIDLVKAVFGAVFALAWMMIGAWLGVRRARSVTPVGDPAHDGNLTTDSTTRNAHFPSRGPTCQRMYDEIRLVRNISGAASFRR
jgi:hypothetical protein